MVPVRIMPAQGSVSHPAPLPARVDAAVAEEHHERQRQVLRPRRARRRRRDRPTPQFAQDPRRRLPAGHPRADAGNHAVGYAGELWRGEEPVARRLRHLGTVYRPGREHRRPLRPARIARALDRGTRRQRSSVATLVGVWPRAPRRARTCRHAFRPASAAAAREGRHECFADALRSPGHCHAGDGIRRHSRESPARRNAEDDARARDAPASGSELRCLDSGVHHARVRAQRGRPRSRDHPQQHQSSGIRANDHRPQFPGEDQRQYRQLGRLLVDRGRSRQDDLGDPLGRQIR